MIPFRKHHAQYSEHIDYLLASVIFLGTNNKHWSRTPTSLAGELELDREKLIAVFEAFSGLYRKSKERNKENNEFPYSLQARYARIEGKDKDGKDGHPPLSASTLRLLYDFIPKSADEERAGFRSALGFGLTVLAALVSAAAAIYVAVIKEPSPPAQIQLTLPASAVPAATR